MALPFTKEETAYKEALKSLTFFFRDGQGYLSRRNSDGEFIGFYPEVAKMFCEKLGVDCVQTILMDDDVDGPVIYPDFYYDHYWANENRTDITQPYVRVNYYAITNKRNQIDANTCKVVAVPDFFVTKDFIKPNYDDSQILWYTDYLACIDAVRSGSADIAYVNSTTAEYYLSQYRYSTLAFALTDYSHRACLGVYGDDTGLLASILNKNPVGHQFQRAEHAPGAMHQRTARPKHAGGILLQESGSIRIADRAVRLPCRRHHISAVYLKASGKRTSISWKP